ncbi:MAG TPA: hypothetical protein VHG10_13790 [Glycomyces sp.]|nr:hypothetical protein [Glycomyces sp.]
MVRGISTAITMRRAAALAIAGAAATALSACGAGLVTQTDTKQSAIDGVNVDKGDLALRDLEVEYDSSEGYAAGDDAPLRIWISNEGDEEVSLVGIRSEGGTVTFVSPADQAEEAMEEARESADATGDAGETGTPEGDATAEETSTPGDDAAEAPAAEEFEGEAEFEPIPIAPAGYVNLAQGDGASDYFMIENLEEDLLFGEAVAVTFVFSDGTEVSAELPIGQPLEPDERSYFEPEEAEGH